MGTPTKAFRKNLRLWRKGEKNAIYQQALEASQHSDASAPELFEKRRYHRPGELLQHCLYLANGASKLPLAVDMASSVLRATLSTKPVDHKESGALISPDFRERLMLAVSSVNACKACSYAHARAALTEGLSDEEIAQLLSGDFHACPDNQHPALLYAQHWAETDGNPAPETRAALLEQYGEKQARAIEFTLGSIRIGNYIGNTLEYLEFKYRLSQARKSISGPAKHLP